MQKGKIVLEKHIVKQEINKVRLSNYAVNIFSLVPTKSGIKKAIKRGEVFVNNKQAQTGTFLQSGDIIELYENTQKQAKIYKIELNIVYQDEHIAVINKQGGIIVSGNRFRTVENALPYNLYRSGQNDALKTFRPVHRLDSATCGLLLIAKTVSAHIKLGKEFERKKISKKYRAIVIGMTPEKGVIKSNIEGKQSVTNFTRIRYKTSRRFGYLTLLDLYPLTGRTHQLRIHTANSGFAILGDKLYGEKDKILYGKGLFLCAVELKFKHPFFDKFQTIGIQEPQKFEKFSSCEKENFNTWLNRFIINNLSKQAAEKIFFLSYKNYRLFNSLNEKFVVFEDQWIHKPEIIKSKIISIFGKSNRIYARHCVIRKIDRPTTDRFLNENHIYGTTTSKHRLGLFIENNLVAIATFAGQRNFKSGRSAEMLRFCNRNFTTVIGGLGKLIKAYKTLYKPNDIMTYVDIDWGKGKAFKQLGFINVSKKEKIKFYCRRSSGERISEKYFNDYKNLQKYECIKNSGSIKFVLKIL